MSNGLRADDGMSDVYLECDKGHYIMNWFLYSYFTQMICFCENFKSWIGQ